MKTRNNKHIIILCIGCIIMGLHTGCKSSKSLSKTTTTQQSSLHQVVSKALAATPKFNTAEASKMTIKVDMSKRSFSTGARFTLHNDSAFHLSILPLLGIEAVRAEVTPAEAIVIDKMNKRYVRCQLDDIASSFGMKIGYRELQSIICAQIFAIGEPNYFIRPDHNIQVTTNDKIHIISFECNGFEHEYRVSANSDYKLQSTTIRKTNTNLSIHIDYADYQLQNDVIFPHNIKMIVNDGKQTASCTFSLTKTIFNQPVNLTNTSLNRYNSISLQELLSK